MQIYNRSSGCGAKLSVEDDSSVIINGIKALLLVGKQKSFEPRRKNFIL
jgi:hypothetical protein